MKIQKIWHINLVNQTDEHKIEIADRLCKFYVLIAIKFYAGFDVVFSWCRNIWCCVHIHAYIT